MITMYTTSLIVYTTKDLEEVDSTIIKVTTIGLEEETEEATSDPKDVVINYTCRRNLLLYLFVENPSALFIRRKATSQRIIVKKIRKLRRIDLEGGIKILIVILILLLLTLKVLTKIIRIIIPLLYLLKFRTTKTIRITT